MICVYDKAKDDSYTVCGSSSGRERDRREGFKGSNYSDVVNNNGNKKMDDYTYTVYHHPKYGRIEIWIGKELKELVKLHGLNLSKFVREKLKEHFKEQGIEIEEPDPPLILLVRCPFCSRTFKTTTIKQVRCRFCNKTFRVFTRRFGSRIVSIVKGNRNLLFKAYYQVYGGKKK